MKNLILILVLNLTVFINAMSQCATRPYTPEWDWRGSGLYTFIARDVNGQAVSINVESPWFATKILKTPENLLYKMKFFRHLFSEMYVLFLQYVLLNHMRN